MTDEQLLDLIETKAPEELTLNELAWLERRLKESPMLREALAARLGMEQYLSAALGRVNVSVDDILSRARQCPGALCQSRLARRGLDSLPLIVGLRGTGAACRVLPAAGGGSAAWPQAGSQSSPGRRRDRRRIGQSSH